MMNDLAGSHLWFYRNFADQLTRVVELMAGEAPLTETSEFPGTPPIADGAAPPGDSILFEAGMNLGPGAIVIVAAPEPAWKTIGERILQHAGLDPKPADELKSTFRETVDQTISGLASAAGARLEREVVSVACKLVSDLQGEFRWAAVEVILGPDCSVTLFCGASAVLLDSLRPAEAPAGRRGANPGALSAPSNPLDAAQSAAEALVVRSKTVDLILDVELPICVSFGRAQLLLKDVLKLNTGSIIELNRTVNEPVEIIVNGSVIARGEVVVVEGNFGVRIQNVISRQERIRSLY